MAQNDKDSQKAPAGPVHLSIRTRGEQPIQRCGVEYGPKVRTVTVEGGSSAWHLLLADPLLKVTKTAAPKVPEAPAKRPDNSQVKAESDAAQS